MSRSANSDAVLKLKGVSKRFPGVRALDDVHFDMRRAEVHALLGENGAGKSTLIKIISGVHQPDSGEMLMDGAPVRFDSPGVAQRHGVATIYQELLLFPELSVAENIFIGHAPRTRIGRLDWKKMRQLAEQQLASLDIHDLDVDRLVGTLSVGNRQRVEIAKALSQDARLLIMDEPTAALTDADVQKLFDIVRILRTRGVGVIYISHRLEEVFELADRVTVLRDGEYVATKAVADTNESDLIGMMVGRTIDNLFPKLDVDVGEPMLEVKGLTRRPLTRDVSLTIRQGEIVGLAGLVGAGRSELALTLFGITPAQSGSIVLNGKAVRINAPADATSLGIAYEGLIREMRIRENVSLAVLKKLSFASFINRSAEAELAGQSIDQFNIRASSSEQIVNKLSGGNQQKGESRSAPPDE